MNLELTGRRAIVTGGSRGIGRAICLALADEGVDVATCARGAGALADTLEELRGRGVRAFGDPVDVANADAYRSWLATAVDRLGGLDVFVANVAAPSPGPGDAAWISSFEVDLMHAVRGLEAVEDALADDEPGSAVLIATVSAVLSQVPPGEEPYGAMKAALVTFMAQKAQQLGPRGVRVNAVSPGPIYFEGGIWHEIERENPGFFETVRQMTALERMGTPEDVARLVVFLASPAAAFVTGSNVRIDGGIVKTVNQ